MLRQVRDIGSLFHTLEAGDPEWQQLLRTTDINPNSYSIYYTGRHAIHAILDHIQLNNPIDVLWLPSYFCHNVLNSISTVYSNVQYYNTHPFRAGIEYVDLHFAGENDVVFVNNYWGINTLTYHNPNKTIVIEDHSHGWQSKAMLTSSADYGICSVRKSYPVALGAVAWQPSRKMGLNHYIEELDDLIIKAEKNIQKAQLKKREFLNGGSLDLQPKYLNLVNKGENLVSSSSSFCKPEPAFIKMVQHYLTHNVNDAKRKNLDYLKSLVKESNHFEYIGMDCDTPFGLLLLFKDLKRFESFKKDMIASSIYPANLWPRNEAVYFFNIHVDFRYDLEDMQYLANALNRWIEAN